MNYKVIKVNILFQLKIHRNYNKSDHIDLDVGLIKLNRKIYFKKDNLIAPICIPTVRKLFIGEIATATGWGVTSNLKGEYTL